MVHGFHSIKTVFLVGIIGMVGLVFFFQTAMEIIQFRSVLEDRAADELRAKAGEVRDHLENPFRDAGTSCEYLASTLEAMEPYDNGLLMRILDRMASASSFVVGSGFWFEPYKYYPDQKYYGPYKYRNTDGQIELTWQYSNEQYDYLRYDWYKQGFLTKENVVWSYPYIDSVTGVPMITATSPVRKAGDVIAVTTVDIGLQELTAYVRSIKIGSSGYAFLVASNGFYIGHPNQDKDLTARITFDEDPGLLGIGEKVLKARELTVDRVTVNREPAFVVYGPVRDTGLRVVMIYPEQEAFASANQAFWTSICIFIIGLVFISGFLWCVFTHRINRPLTRLMTDAERISGGELSVPVVVGSSDEMGFLARGFEHMRQKLFGQVAALQRSNSDLSCAYEEITALNEELEAQLREITELNQGLELRVEERTSELTATNQELVATIENLRTTQFVLVQSEKMAALGRLVAGVAHEVNTPLGVGVTAASQLQRILWQLDMLYQRGNLAREDLEEYIDEAGESMAILVANLERAAHLIRSFKRVSVDQSTELRRSFKVKEYLDEILLSLYPKIKGTKITISVTGDETLEINSFPGPFAQIITNLVDNSLLHAYDKGIAGKIHIHFLTADDQFRLIYTDDGKGMEPEIAEHIFEPFFTTKQNSGGTGLGMHIVYNMVSQIFEGTIECESKPGKGTVFTISFSL